MPLNTVIVEDVMNDFLFIGAFAAKLFVKNSAHQAQAGNLITAIAQIFQQVESQLPAQSATPTVVTSISTGTSTAGTTTNPQSPAPIPVASVSTQVKDSTLL